MGVAIVKSQLMQRPKSPGGVTLRLPPHVRSLAASHVLVAPGVPFCVMCGWGPKGKKRLRWLANPCTGYCVPEWLDQQQVAAPVHGCVEVKGVRLHPSHSVVGYRGYFVCVHCGYVAASHVVELKEQ